MDKQAELIQVVGYGRMLICRLWRYINHLLTYNTETVLGRIQFTIPIVMYSNFVDQNQCTITLNLSAQSQTKFGIKTNPDFRKFTPKNPTMIEQKLIFIGDLISYRIF